MAGTTHDGAQQDVFDVADWLDRANHRDSAQAPTAYEPRHRADVPVDSVA